MDACSNFILFGADIIGDRYRGPASCIAHIVYKTVDVALTVFAWASVTKSMAVACSVFSLPVGVTVAVIGSAAICIFFSLTTMKKFIELILSVRSVWDRFANPDTDVLLGTTAQAFVNALCGPTPTNRHQVPQKDVGNIETDDGFSNEPVIEVGDEGEPVLNETE